MLAQGVLDLVSPLTLHISLWLLRQKYYFSICISLGNEKQMKTCEDNPSVIFLS